MENRAPGLPLRLRVALPLAILGLVGVAAAAGSDASLTTGKQIYAADCATCHHATGSGLGPTARHLSAPPMPLVAGTYKFTSTPAGHPPAPSDLERTVSRGVPGTSMPAFDAVLEQGDRQDVAAYLMSLTPAFAQRDAPDTVEVIPEPADAPASAEQGQQLFLVMECYGCHGVDGRGRGPQSHGLTDSAGNAIRPRDFTAGWFKSGGEPLGIYRAIHTGLSGTPMVAYGQALLFGGDSVADLSPYTHAYDASALAALLAWLAEQPTERHLGTMSPAESRDLAGKRVWALVHYVQSLRRGRSPLLAWLLANLDETR